MDFGIRILSAIGAAFPASLARAGPPLLRRPGSPSQKATPRYLSCQAVLLPMSLTYVAGQSADYRQTFCGTFCAAQKVIRLPFAHSQVQDRYNSKIVARIEIRTLSNLRRFSKILRLPTVPLSYRIFVVAVALQAEGHPFEPDTAHQMQVGSMQNAVSKRREMRVALCPSGEDPDCFLLTAFCLLVFKGDVVQLVRTHACHA